MFFFYLKTILQLFFFSLGTRDRLRRFTQSKTAGRTSVPVIYCTSALWIFSIWPCIKKEYWQKIIGILYLTLFGKEGILLFPCTSELKLLGRKMTCNGTFWHPEGPAPVKRLPRGAKDGYFSFFLKPLPSRVKHYRERINPFGLNSCENHHVCKS